MTLIEAFIAVHSFFKGNEDKFCAWLISRNPQFGGLSPFEMIQRGREKRLCNFIENAMEENEL